MIPEGTRIKWNLNTTNTESAHLVINENVSTFENQTNKTFLLEKTALSDFTYNLQLKNEYGTNRSEIEYHVKVVKDEYPQIQVVYLPDTILYQSIELSGSLHDDYGVSAISLSYRKGFSAPFQKVRLLSNIKSAGPQVLFQLANGYAGS